MDEIVESLIDFLDDEGMGCEGSTGGKRRRTRKRIHKARRKTKRQRKTKTQRKRRYKK